MENESIMSSIFSLSIIAINTVMSLWNIMHPNHCIIMTANYLFDGLVSV